MALMARLESELYSLRLGPRGRLRRHSGFSFLLLHATAQDGEEKRRRRFGLEASYDQEGYLREPRFEEGGIRHPRRLRYAV